MRSADFTVPSPSDDERALPRGVIRALRSGALDEARTRRVLAVHGLEESALERIVQRVDPKA